MFWIWPFIFTLIVVPRASSVLKINVHLQTVFSPIPLEIVGFSLIPFLPAPFRAICPLPLIDEAAPLTSEPNRPDGVFYEVEDDIIFFLVSHGHQVGLERRLQSQSQTDQSYRVVLAESFRLHPGQLVLHIAVAFSPAFRPTGGTTAFGLLVWSILISSD